MNRTPTPCMACGRYFTADEIEETGRCIGCRLKDHGLTEAERTNLNTLYILSGGPLEYGYATAEEMLEALANDDHGHVVKR